MAIAITEKRQSQAPVDYKFFRGNLGSYATGGVACGPAETGFRVVLGAIVVGSNDLTRRFVFDPAAGKIMAITTSTGAEVANATDLSSLVLDLIIFGY